MSSCTTTIYTRAKINKQMICNLQWVSCWPLVSPPYEERKEKVGGGIEVNVNLLSYLGVFDRVGRSITSSWDGLRWVDGRRVSDGDDRSGARRRRWGRLLTWRRELDGDDGGRHCGSDGRGDDTDIAAHGHRDDGRRQAETQRTGHWSAARCRHSVFAIIGRLLVQQLVVSVLRVVGRFQRRRRAGIARRRGCRQRDGRWRREIERQRTRWRRQAAWTRHGPAGRQGTGIRMLILIGLRAFDYSRPCRHIYVHLIVARQVFTWKKQNKTKE